MERIALFDFDKVIYNGHSIFDIIQSQESDGYIEAGVWDEVEEQLMKYNKEEVSYKEAADKMLTSWARGLRGKTYKSAVDYVQSYFDEHPSKFFSWFEQVLPLLKDSHKTFIVTANYQFIAEAVVSKFELDGYLASESEVEKGVFTGKLEKSLAGNKGEVVGLLERYSNEGSIAVGDSENDIQMLEKVQYPICFQPNEKLIQTARERNWMIVDEASIASAIQNALL